MMAAEEEAEASSSTLDGLITGDVAASIFTFLSLMDLSSLAETCRHYISYLTNEEHQVK